MVQFSSVSAKTFACLWSRQRSKLLFVLDSRDEFSACGISHRTSHEETSARTGTPVSFAYSRTRGKHGSMFRWWKTKIQQFHLCATTTFSIVLLIVNYCHSRIPTTKSRPYSPYDYESTYRHTPRPVGFYHWPRRQDIRHVWENVCRSQRCPHKHRLCCARNVCTPSSTMRRSPWW